MESNKLYSFSVIVAAHNEEKYIADCIRALKLQDYQGEFEIIVVDNASSDKTSEIAKDLGVQPISEPQKGVSHALITGSFAAKGEIFAYTDADTRPPKDWLTKLNRALNFDFDIAAVGGPFYFYDSPSWANFIMKNLVVKMYIKYFHKREQGLPGSNMAIRKDYYFKVGGFEPGFDWAQDMKLAKKVSSLGRVIFDPDIFIWTSFRRFHNGYKNPLLIIISCFKELCIGFLRLIAIIYFNKNLKPQRPIR